MIVLLSICLCVKTHLSLCLCNWTIYLFPYFFFHFWRRKFGESKLTFKKIERNARRYKNRKYPSLPKRAIDIIKTFNDKAIVDKYGFNLRKSKRFYIDTVVHGTFFFSVFASHQVISLIEKYIAPKDRRYLIDGTFKVVPLNKYYQLLIIHIQHKNDVSLIVFSK